jgi:hypothetical protein
LFCLFQVTAGHDQVSQFLRNLRLRGEGHAVWPCEGYTLKAKIGELDLSQNPFKRDLLE